MNKPPINLGHRPTLILLVCLLLPLIGLGYIWSQADRTPAPAATESPK